MDIFCEFEEIKANFLSYDLHQYQSALPTPMRALIPLLALTASATFTLGILSIWLNVNCLLSWQLLA